MPSPFPCNPVIHEWPYMVVKSRYKKKMFYVIRILLCLARPVKSLHARVHPHPLFFSKSKLKISWPKILKP